MPSTTSSSRGETRDEGARVDGVDDRAGARAGGGRGVGGGEARTVPATGGRPHAIGQDPRNARGPSAAAPREAHRGRRSFVRRRRSLCGVGRRGGAARRADRDDARARLGDRVAAGARIASMDKRALQRELATLRAGRRALAAEADQLRYRAHAGRRRARPSSSRGVGLHLRRGAVERGVRRSVGGVERRGGKARLRGA